MQNFKLDKIDFKILWELDENTRQSFTSIARKVHRTPQEVKRRYDALVEQGIIRYCWPMVEYRHVGHFFLVYFLKLHNMSGAQEKEFYAFLNNINEVPIIMRGDGYFDVYIGICAKGIFASESVFQLINQKYSQHIMLYETVIPIGFYQFRRNYLVGRCATTPRVALTGREVGQLPLKKDAIRVLELLNKDARLSVNEIAQKLGLGYEKVKGSVRKLENLGVIQSYTFLLDHAKLGFPRYRVLLQLRSMPTLREQEFFGFCNLNANIIHYLRLLGAWHLVLDIEIESREKLRALIREIKLKFSDIVYRIEPTEVYQIDRFRDIPQRIG